MAGTGETFDGPPSLREAGTGEAGTHGVDADDIIVGTIVYDTELPADPYGKHPGRVVSITPNPRGGEWLRIQSIVDPNFTIEVMRDELHMFRDTGGRRKRRRATKKRKHHKKRKTIKKRK